MQRSGDGHEAVSHEREPDGAVAAPALAAERPVTVLRGVGPATAGMLAAAGIATLGDLLRFFPRRHGEMFVLGADSPLPDGIEDGALAGRPVRLHAEIDRVRGVRLRGGRSLAEVRVSVCGGRLGLVARFFNQPWMARSLEAGQRRTFEGVLEDRADGMPQALDQPRLLSVDDPLGDLPCTVRYPRIEGLGESRLRALVGKALSVVDLDAFVQSLSELPAELAGRALTRRDAVRAMHLPQDVAEHEGARRSFALFEAVELFRALEALRADRARLRAPAVAAAPQRAIDRAMAAARGFEFTLEQDRAVEVLRRGLAGDQPMSVLLQGDVGTGKTAVAADAIARVAKSGLQAALLAPTRILAEQHVDRIAPWLEALGLRTAFWSSNLAARPRTELAAAVRAGEVDVVVGTHALAGDDLEFRSLGLVVIDEQHRFGVELRERLVRKGGGAADGGRTPFDAAHLLVMTATPIPRTLANVWFGDLDIVELRERPTARPPAPAVYVPRSRWPRVVRAIVRAVRRGGRVFVVCPRIGEDGGKGGVDALVRALANEPGLNVAALHGRMPSDERRDILARFRAGSGCDVLVATTVVEVGVDVPEATLVVVVSAERFGTATLHQLRGRVGRGHRRGLCILAAAHESVRIRSVCRTVDGFELAEADLAERGPGEFLGLRQSGIGELRALDPVADRDLLTQARQAVRAERVANTR